MIALSPADLAWWAIGASCLGWLYCGLAVSWPCLFHAAVIQHAARQPDGYRLGWAIYWRLPTRPALILTVASAAPLLAVWLLPAALAAAALLVMSLGLSLIWLTHSPGQRLGIIAHGPGPSGPLFELRAAGRAGRAVVVLVIFGLIPAAALGRLAADALGVWRR